MRFTMAVHTGAVDATLLLASTIRRPILGRGEFAKPSCGNKDGRAISLDKFLEDPFYKRV
jgi:hypothetical protein